MKNRFAKRTDGNQAEIVDALRKYGWQVIVTNYGSDFPDLLCGKFDKWMLLEVKEPDGCLDRGQLEFFVDSRGPVTIATDPIQATNAQPLNITQKVLINLWLKKNPTQETLSVKKFQKMISGSNGSTCSKK